MAPKLVIPCLHLDVESMTGTHPINVRLDTSLSNKVSLDIWPEVDITIDVMCYVRRGVERKSTTAHQCVVTYSGVLSENMWVH